MYTVTYNTHTHMQECSGVLVQPVHMYICTECSHVKDHGRTVSQQLIHKRLCLLLVHGDHILFTHPPSLSFNISGFLGDHSTTTRHLPCINNITEICNNPVTWSTGIVILEVRDRESDISTV